MRRGMIIPQPLRNYFPEEVVTSTVLLQRLVTRLRSDIGSQLLLKKPPTNFAVAFKEAADIEYALEFNNSGDNINTLTHKPTITTEF